MDEAQLVEQERSMAAGRAAGYCWVQNPDGPGRCTRPAEPAHEDHEDAYALTSWR
ncbi:hypothetical protein [Streptomyces sp. SAS_275]|uniref:hypothetical protein n=1 Tax=Streptomyces sp. SAS_275 TaxID=3412746 RepID=UPI00403C957A